jgi:hypothetical protein
MRACMARSGAAYVVDQAAQLWTTEWSIHGVHLWCTACVCSYEPAHRLIHGEDGGQRA